MSTFRTLLWLIPPLEPGIAAAWGIAALAVLGSLYLAWRLRKGAVSRKLLEAQVSGLTRDLEKSNRILHEALTAIENENFTDPLTDLHNRRYISAVIKADVAKVQRAYRDSGPEPRANQDLVFLMVDLDHFSLINEYYGSSVGDQVLVLVSQTLRRVVRESDAVIRWGGEEFLVVARDTSRREAPELAERIRTIMAGQSIETSKGEILRWTCSIGFAAFPFQTLDISWLAWDRVVELTDACLHVAKKSGRNAWVGVQPKPGLERAKHGARMPKELDRLVGEGVLEVLSSREDPFGKTKKVGEILG
jgi:diguanylate cyclase (GGDEF)-like protein